MVYIDSDGVLSDFESWVLTTDCKDRFSPDEVCKTMIKYQNDVFIKAKPKKTWLWKKLKRDDVKVLTALPEKDQFITYFSSEDEYRKCISIMKENKYKWFENFGISRDKVIIVETRKEKFDYCKPGDYLFDDYPKTTEEWTGFGGIGVLVRNSKSKAQQNWSPFKVLKIRLNMMRFRFK